MKNKKDYLMDMAIPMVTFLNDFVFADGSGKYTAVNKKTGQRIDLALMEDINHYDLSDLEFDGVKRASWSEVSAESILKGEIILVRAASWKGKGSMVIPYYRPQLILGDGYAAAMKKDFNEREESQPLPTSYSLRRWKKNGRKGIL